MSETSRVSPTREDAVVRSVSEVVGGPLGDHAGQHPWWTPLRVVLLLAAVALSFGIAAKAPCLAQVGDTADISVPLAHHLLFQPDRPGRAAPGYWWLSVMARLAPGA